MDLLKGSETFDKVELSSISSSRHVLRF